MRIINYKEEDPLLGIINKQNSPLPSSWWLIFGVDITRQMMFANSERPVHKSIHFESETKKALKALHHHPAAVDLNFSIKPLHRNLIASKLQFLHRIETLAA